MPAPSCVSRRLFPEPRYSDASIELCVDAGCVSYRERERGTSQLRIRTLFVTNRESSPFLAQVHFNQQRTFVIVPQRGPVRIDVDYFFETPTVDGDYPRTAGVLRLYRTSASIVAIEKAALSRLRRELVLAYRFTFDVQHVVGREGVILL